MGVTIWILLLLVLLAILFVFEKKQHKEYLAELEILDEPYMRLLEAGVLSGPTNKRHEYRP